MKHLMLILSLALLAPSLSSCGCTLELGIEVKPSNPIILSVGETVVATVTFTSCGGWQRWQEPLTWTSQNPGIASVHPKTGAIKGHKAGETNVIASGENVGDILILVIVESPD